MKTKLLFVLLGMFMGISLVNAQPGRGHMSAEEMARHQTARTTEALNLDKATSEKLYRINLKYAEKMKDAFAHRSSDREGVRAQMMAIRDQKNKELKGLFTSEQFEQYQKEQQEMWQQRRGNRR